MSEISWWTQTEWPYVQMGQCNVDGQQYMLTNHQLLNWTGNIVSIGSADAGTIAFFVDRQHTMDINHICRALIKSGLEPVDELPYSMVSYELHRIRLAEDSWTIAHEQYERAILDAADALDTPVQWSHDKLNKISGVYDEVKGLMETERNRLTQE